MKTINLKNIAYDVFNTEIKLLLQTNSGKWYECKYDNIEPTEIKTESVYGVVINNMIYFDFKTGKNEDTIIKTFITQFVNKYECKRPSGIDENGNLIYPKKEDIIKKVSNSDRVEKYLFYTTLYGIGYFCLFMSQSAKSKVNGLLAEYLKNKGIRFKNEYSDANWVYRFVINQKVEIHNVLLTEFNF